MNKKTIIIISLLFLCVFISANFAFADRGLEVTYPEVSGIAPDNTTNLAEFIKYIFNLSIGISGLLAFAIFIYGGLRHLTSAGNASAITDARSWMFGGIAGLLLLLTSYLILTAINPDLIIFKKMIPLQSDTGICLCSETTCELPCSGPDKKYYTMQDIPRIDITKFAPKSIKFISPQDELTSIFLFANPNFIADDKTQIKKIDNNNDGKTSILDPLFRTSVPSIPISDFIPIDKDFISLSFLKNKPGIYLYQKTDYCLEDPDDEKSEYLCLTPPMYISSSIRDLGDWKQTARSIKFNKTEGKNIGAVLFTDNGFTGKCAFGFGKNDIPNLDNKIDDVYDFPIGNDALSSLTIFNQSKDKALTGTVTFYDTENCDEAFKKKRFIPSNEDQNPGDPIMRFWNLTKPNCYIDADRSDSTGTGQSDFCIFDNIDIDDTEEKELHRNILSYKIDGNFQVLLNTQKCFGRPLGTGTCPAVSREAVCQILEPDDEGCVDSVIGKNIYSATDEGAKIESMMIIPLQ